MFFLNNGTINASSPTIANDSKLTIKSNGNVGIGTTNPNGKLEVVDEKTDKAEFSIYNYTPYGNENKAESRINLGKIE